MNENLTCGKCRVCVPRKYITLGEGNTSYTNECLRPGIDLDRVDPDLTPQENFEKNGLQNLYKTLSSMGGSDCSCVKPRVASS